MGPNCCIWVIDHFSTLWNRKIMVPDMELGYDSFISEKIVILPNLVYISKSMPQSLGGSLGATIPLFLALVWLSFGNLKI